MKIDLTDPDIIYKVYKNLTKKARQRLVLAAACGKDAFYTQLNTECVLIAVGVETDSSDEDDDEDDYY
jgi:hypothetical protein